MTNHNTLRFSTTTGQHAKRMLLFWSSAFFTIKTCLCRRISFQYRLTRTRILTSLKWHFLQGVCSSKSSLVFVFWKLGFTSDPRTSYALFVFLPCSVYYFFSVYMLQSWANKLKLKLQNGIHVSVKQDFSLEMVMNNFQTVCKIWSWSHGAKPYPSSCHMDSKVVYVLCEGIFDIIHCVRIF